MSVLVTAPAWALETTRVSVSSSDIQGNNSSYNSSLSTDGHYVAFSSNATNLVAGDTNGRTDIFVIDRQTGETSLISVSSGGVQGGISNGENLVFRTAFKPTATIMSSQQTVTEDGKDTELAAGGRHDPCVLPRAVPIVEAMTALVLVDHALLQRTQNSDT